MILIVLLLVSVFIISAKSFYHHHHSSQSYDLLKSRPLRRSSGSSITMNGIDDSSNAAKRGNRNKSTALWSRWSSISIKNDDKSTTSAKKKSPSPPPSLLPSSASSLPSSPLDVKNILRNFFSDGDGFTKIENDIIGIQLGLGLVLFLGGMLLLSLISQLSQLSLHRNYYYTHSRYSIYFQFVTATLTKTTTIITTTSRCIIY